MSLKNKIYVKPEKSRLINLLEDIKAGRIRIPIFQRDYVWKKNQRLELFDSLNSGFPIGSLLFWKPQDLVFNYSPKIGPFEIKSSSSNYSYVLDGFQRVSTLFGALINPFTYGDGVNENYNDFVIHYDLKEEEFVQLRGKEEVFQIPLYKLIDTFEFLSFSENLRLSILDVDISSKYINSAKRLANQLLDYEIPFVEIIGGDIEDAVDIFHRINSKGSDISPIWMLNALTYVEDEFRFHNEIKELKEKLERYNFQDLPADIILHCIETSTGKIYFDVNLQLLSKRKDFPLLVKETFTNIEKAVEFLYFKVNVFDNKILPYNLQLIFITEFFRLNPFPNYFQLRELERWFWTTSYANYFSIYSLSKQRIAFNQFQSFARGEISNSIYNDDDRQRFKTLEFPEKIIYGSVRSKCLGLFLIKNYLAYTDSGLLVNNENDFRDFEFKYLINKVKKAEMAIPVKKNSFESSFFDKNNELLSYFEDLVDESSYNALLIDETIVELYRENRVDEMISHRKNLIINSESNFVENLNIEYLGIDSYYYIDNFHKSTIRAHCYRLEWDTLQDCVFYDDARGAEYFTAFYDIDELVFFLDELVIQDVLSELPTSFLKENNEILDYTDEIRLFLSENYFVEMSKIGWDVSDIV
ncbi:DUF262 domain-containing protein [Flavobacterium sp. LHD-85]|uniref:DUF262 domain-containing protein n=1 Tax=Flavobacterium sp. LHD-85 TaxID=3071410 RepID=UPI0027DEB55D|nr:DUF262 domain-containing protein [Flavobacterium sp. LHD-85]MDQ6531062.1 DUF262 domain-containing protein [Flavobacterium sp. LHD-85]